MDQKVVLYTIVGMALVTYLPRVLPVWLLSARSLPAVVVAWLRYIPAAVLAAMLFPSLLLVEQRLDVGFQNLYFWAALPTLLVAWKTRSLFGSVVAGMLLVALARFATGG
jgi:branched-subunit amino acid transport protein